MVGIFELLVYLSILCAMVVLLSKVLALVVTFCVPIIQTSMEKTHIDGDTAPGGHGRQMDISSLVSAHATDGRCPAASIASQPVGCD